MNTQSVIPELPAALDFYLIRLRMARACHQSMRRVFCHKLVIILAVMFTAVGLMAATPEVLGSDKTLWHGFDRYDFVMDENTLAITPIKAPADEGDGIKGEIKGQRRGILVVPRQAATGNPWSWRGCYWDYQPQTEIELLKRGFYVAYIAPDPGKEWDAWYAFLTQKCGLSAKPAFVGMSKGGVNAYAWATVHPDKVSCIYADNPALYPESFQSITALAANDVPLLHVCGSFDYLLEHHTLAVENEYHQLGGRITVIIKEGTAHHPHSLADPKFIVDWIEKNVGSDAEKPPVIPGMNFKKSYYYSFDDSYISFPADNTYATCRGPSFTPCYDRYDAETDSPWGVTGITVLTPQNPAPGKPWIYRANRIDREATGVDLALLAKGFYIVAAPVTAQAGPISNEWDNVYGLLTQAGFSSRPVLEGAGAGAGEAYAWAIKNPDKVAAIYSENPVFHSLMFPQLSILDNLAPLVQAGVPLMNVCGSLDPWFADNAAVLEQRYRQLNGQVTVIMKDGIGHYPLGPDDPRPVVDFVTKAVAR